VTPRAGIVVTGTEVLSGIIADRNGPWLSERLRERGVQLAHVMIVGDRREDLRAALEFLAREGMTLIVTSGGLGPTADDLTAEVVAEFTGREMALDSALEGRIAEILARLRSRFHTIDRPDADRRDQDVGPDAPRGSSFEGAWRAGNRKQAMVPAGAEVLEPVGTAPGLVVGGEPVVVVLPGPPGELQPMWSAALKSETVRSALAEAGVYEQRIMRMFGPPESEIARTLRDAEAAGVPLGRLEITTCLRRGEVEVVTRYGPSEQAVYDALAEFIAARHGDTLFSRDGTSVDDQIARLLTDSGRTIAVAESCTGGLVAGRLTDRAGSSAYALGGLVVYADAAKAALAGVSPELISRVGAVSVEVARALADGVRERLGADVGVGITGIAGPDGGTDEKPVGLVYFHAVTPWGGKGSSFSFPGDRDSIRRRSVVAALHLVRRLLTEKRDEGGTDP